MTETIGNPLSWSVGAMRGTGRHLGSVRVSILGEDGATAAQVRRIGYEDLRIALRRGLDDFAACRSDVAFLCLLYPVIGLTMAWLALQGNLLPLIFPVISGFALVGPVAAVGLYEMSRRREAGRPTSWGDAFAVTGSPSFGAILLLGFALALIFALWVLTANGIYAITLGPEAPATLASFAGEVLTTGAGWAMIVIGMAAGFLFAALVLAISIVSFPMLLDRPVGLRAAVTASMKAARLSPGPVMAWGFVVAVALALGSLPLFLGLIVVLPVLGHATWHLYRRIVVEPAAA